MKNFFILLLAGNIFGISMTTHASWYYRHSEKIVQKKCI